MLAYLALAPDGRESRRTLANLLWGEDADGLTLDNLRTCLWSLRRALGENGQKLIVAEREWIGLDAGAMETDIARLRAALSGTDPAALSEALDATADELLEGLELESGTFQDWLRGARMRHAEAMTNGLRRLMAARRAAGDRPGSVVLAERILRIDPFNEAVLREALDMYAVAGRRDVALLSFRRFADRLQAELGIEPESETLSLVERIAGGSSGSMAARDLAATTNSPPILVGAPSPADVPNEGQQPAPSWPRRLLRSATLRLALMLLVAIGIGVGIGALIWNRPELAPTPLDRWVIQFKQMIAPSRPALAVLQFKSYGDPGATDLAERFADRLTSALAIGSDIQVVPRSTMDEFRAQPPKPEDIARRLRVPHLVEGSVYQSGDVMAVRIALIDIANPARNQTLVERERPARDPRAVDEITREAVTALEVLLTEGPQARITVYQGTTIHEAWLLAQQGHKELRALSPEANLAARGLFEQASKLDPEYAGALTGQAWTYLVEVFLGFSRDPMAAMQTAKALAERALRIDDRRAATHALVGAVALFAGDMKAARALGEHAVGLEYRDADSAGLYAVTLNYAGETRKSLETIEHALNLKPYAPRWYHWLRARALRHLGRTEEAIAELESVDAIGDRSRVPVVELVLAYAEAGKLDRAKLVVADVIRTRFAGFDPCLWGARPAYADPARRQRDLNNLAAAGLGSGTCPGPR